MSKKAFTDKWELIIITKIIAIAEDHIHFYRLFQGHLLRVLYAVALNPHGISLWQTLLLFPVYRRWNLAYSWKVAKIIT